MTARRIAPGVLLGVLLISFAVLGSGCKREESAPKAGDAGDAAKSAPSTQAPSGAVGAGELQLPDIDVSHLPLAVQTRIGEARYQARRAPNDPVKIGELGALCYVQGFPQVAVTCFKRATQLDPNEFAWWYYLARASEKAKDTAQAKAAYEKALAINKDYEATRVRLAALDTASKQSAGASEPIVAPLVVDPLEDQLLMRGGHLRTLAAAAIILAQRGQFSQAQEMLKRARDVDESGVESRTATAQVLVLQGKLDDAARELERLLETPEGKKSTAVRVNLARVHVYRRNLPEAERQAREALEQNPESFDAANILAWLLATNPEPARRNGEEAVKWAEKACALTKNSDHTMLDTLAAAYAAVGRFDDARKTISDAIKFAQDQNRAADVETYQTRLKLYEAGKPYFEAK